MNLMKHLFLILFFTIKSVFLYSQAISMECCGDFELSSYQRIPESMFAIGDHLFGDDGSFPGKYNTKQLHPDYPQGFPLGFTFTFFGTPYDSLFININGNVTFDKPCWWFTSEDMADFSLPMIAPYWADIDLGSKINPNSEEYDFTNGAIYYKQEYTETDSCIRILWYNVGCYGRLWDEEKKMTFQLTLTSGKGDFLPKGTNVGFCYYSIEFTTGTANCSNNFDPLSNNDSSISCETTCRDGYGGTPATVGVTNGEDFVQIGRFDRKGNINIEPSREYVSEGSCTNYSGTDWLIYSSTNDCELLQHDFSSKVVVKSGNCKSGVYGIDVTLLRRAFDTGNVQVGNVSFFYDNEHLEDIELNEMFEERYSKVADGKTHTITFINQATSEILKTVEITAPDPCEPLSIKDVTHSCMDSLYICAQLTGSVSETQLYYRVSGIDADYLSVAMHRSSDSTYCAAIPSPEGDTGIEYYLFAKDITGEEVLYKSPELPDTIFCPCLEVKLSMNPITSKSDTLTLTLPKATQTTIYLLDKQGNPAYSLDKKGKPTSNKIPPVLNERKEAGKYKISLKELFKHNLDPLTPYLLIVETDEQKTLIYLYISKI